MGKPKAPPPPDYQGIAQQQGQENRDTAWYNANLNRANQYTPWGSLTWETRPGADPNHPQAGDWTQRLTLSPEQQALVDQQGRISTGMGNMSEQALGRAQNSLGQPIDKTGLPSIQYMNGWQQNASAGAPNTSVGVGNYMQGVRSVPGIADDASRRRVEEAMMSRLDPQFQRDEEAARSRLLNSGITQGSQAWNDEMARLDQSRNDARMQSVLAGGQEESRQTGLNAALQQQDWAQRMGYGNQDFQQRLQSAEFGNKAQDQSFAQQHAIDQMVNSLAQQQAQFNNQTRASDLQERAWERQLPLNELQALRSGAQVQQPRFDPYYTGNSQSTDLMSGAMAQGQYDMNKYNQGMASANATYGAIASILAALI